MSFKSVFTIVLMLGMIPSLVSAQDYLLRVSGVIGQKELGSDWEAPSGLDGIDLTTHSMTGIDLDFGQKDNWLSGVFRYQSGEETDFYYGLDVLMETDEYLFGVRFNQEFSETFHGYVGGGYAYVDGELSFSDYNITVSESDSYNGYWIGGGIYYGRRDHGSFMIGIDWTYTDYGDQTIYYRDMDTAGLTTSLTVGWTF